MVFAVIGKITGLTNPPKQAIVNPDANPDPKQAVNGEPAKVQKKEPKRK